MSEAMAPSARLRAPAAQGLLVSCALLGALGCGKAGDAESGPKPSMATVARAVLNELFASGDRGGEESAPGFAGETTRPDAWGALSSDDPALLVATEPEEEAPTTCVIPYNGVVTVLPMRSERHLERAVAATRSATLVYETDDTAIFDDGRILTASVETVGDHLGAVGWVDNPIEIMGASSRRSAPAAYTWSAGSDASRANPKKLKKKRRG